MSRLARTALRHESRLWARRVAEIGMGMGMALLAVFVAGYLPSSPDGRSAPPPPQSSLPPVAGEQPAPAQASPSADLAAMVLPDRAPRIASYTLKVSLDPATHRLHGEGTIAWTNTSRVAQHELYVHLYLNAFKNDRTALLRERGVAGRGSAELADFGYTKVTRFAAREWNSDLWAGAERTTPGDAEDETDIHVPLPQAVEPGQSITIDMAWDAKLPAVNIRTGYDGSFHMVGQWFPKLAVLEPDGRWAHFPFQRFSEFYADYGSYDVTVDVPEAFVVGATGRLEHEEKQGGRSLRRFVQDNVHDFAFTAWDQFREMTATEGDVHISCLYPPGYDDAAATEIAAARFGLAHLGAAYGRYPYGTLTIVHPPPEAQEAGGMEYPTLITTGGPWYARYTGVRILESVTIHELGHQWFYGLLASNEHEYPFLDEGLNSFAEADAIETLHPASSAVDSLGLTISLPAAFRLRAAELARSVPVAQPAPAFTSGGEYGALVYGRTATILRTLAQVHGADRVKLALGRYARSRRFTHPVPDDLLASFKEVLGPDVADNLRVALFDKGWVDYEVDRVASSKNDPPAGIFGDPDATLPAPAVGAERPPWRGYAIVRRSGTLRFPVDIDLIAEDGTVTRTAWDAGTPTIQIEYTGQTPLVAAVVDPDHRVLVDDHLGNNARRATGISLAPRVLERALFTAELMQLLIAP